MDFGDQLFLYYFFDNCFIHFDDVFLACSCWCWDSFLYLFYHLNDDHLWFLYYLLHYDRNFDILYSWFFLYLFDDLFNNWDCFFDGDDLCLFIEDYLVVDGEVGGDLNDLEHWYFLYLDNLDLNYFLMDDWHFLLYHTIIWNSDIDGDKYEVKRYFGNEVNDHTFQ